MVFSSYTFLMVFLPIVVAGFYALRGFGVRNASLSFLLLGSFAFYGYWSLTHLALLIGSVAINFFTGQLTASLQTRHWRKLILIAGILFNLSLIFWFKYFDFVASNAVLLTGTNYTFQNLILPLGISFFTFQQIAYLVDCYQSKSYEKAPRDYALFVSFFPQLIAGPIVHHKHMRSQFSNLATAPAKLDMLPYGLMIFAMGLAKKTLIADPIAREIDPIWALAANGEPISAALAWTAAIGYSLQIYFDFSGYCDMAIGAAAMVGLRLPINFNSPYKSKSIIEFWRRWHITLSSFLRDYIYIPLGGNKFGELFKLRNIFITMIIGGIWHGAAWTFIIWGVIHASLITINHALRIWAPAFTAWSSPDAIVAKRAATLMLIMFAWIFFRATDLSSAFNVIGGLMNFENTGGVEMSVLLLILFASMLALFAPNSLEVAGYTENLKETFPKENSLGGRLLQPTPLSATATAIMIAGGLMVAWKPAAFIYFNF